MDCTKCTFAEWKRTPNGRLHPSGDGRCAWEGYKNWKIPAAFYFPGQRDIRVVAPPCGGVINRRDPISANECACFNESLAKP